MAAVALCGFTKQLGWIPIGYVNQSLLATVVAKFQQLMNIPG
jgi:hypothetical protein